MVLLFKHFVDVKTICNHIHCNFQNVVKKEKLYSDILFITI